MGSDTDCRLGFTLAGQIRAQLELIMGRLCCDYSSLTERRMHLMIKIEEIFRPVPKSRFVIVPGGRKIICNDRS